MTAKRASKRRKLSKTGTANGRTRAIKPAKRTRLVNFTAPAQALKSAVPPIPGFTESLIDGLYSPGKVADLAYESQPGIMPRGHVHGYVKALIHAGFSLTQMELLHHVKKKNRTHFYQFPQNYITVTDLFMVKGFTGISVDRQLNLLINGLVNGEHCNFSEGIYTTVESILNTIPRAPGSPSLPPDVAPLDDLPEPVPAQPEPPEEGPPPGNIFDIDPLSL